MSGTLPMESPMVCSNASRGIAETFLLVDKRISNCKAQSWDLACTIPQRHSRWWVDGSEAQPKKDTGPNKVEITKLPIAQSAKQVLSSTARKEFSRARRSSNKRQGRELNSSRILKRSELRRRAEVAASSTASDSSSLQIWTQALEHTRIHSALPTGAKQLQNIRCKSQDY